MEFKRQHAKIAAAILRRIKTLKPRFYADLHHNKEDGAVEPTVRIESPSKDTTVAGEDGSIRISGVVGNTADVDSVSISGLDIYDSIDTDSSFFATVSLVEGENEVILSVYYQTGVITHDTLLIAREPLPMTGLATLSGTLTKEGEALAKRARIARNAAGDEQVITHKAVPMSGAYILVYDADTTTTPSIGSAKTDSTGR